MTRHLPKLHFASLMMTSAIIFEFTVTAAVIYAWQTHLKLNVKEEPALTFFFYSAKA